MPSEQCPVRNTLTITEDLLSALTDAVFEMPGREGAAYILCGTSVTGDEIRLLAREVIPVEAAHYRVREVDRLSIHSDSYVPMAKRAKLNRESVLFVHSHPACYPGFSPQDDQEDSKLMEFFAARASTTVHGEMVLSSPSILRGRVWANGGWNDLERIRIIGNRFQFKDFIDGEEPIPEFFDRQVRAFGPDVQRLLRRLHIGVVGAGGTGSAVIEQLARLGVGRISIFDGDGFDKSNVTRVHGSRVADQGHSKARIQGEHAASLGLGTKLHVFPQHITKEATAKELRSCDVVFGCTDKHAPRGLLVQLAMRYLIPCIDMGVKVDSKDQNIRGIWGRVTTVLPGEACLFCRGTINSETIRAEGLPPEERNQEIADGYITEIATNEPAVIMFTTAVAAQAISELLHRLTGFMGEDRCSTEAVMLLHESRIRTNRQDPVPDCLCQQHSIRGRGDTRDFLGLFWG